MSTSFTSPLNSNQATGPLASLSSNYYDFQDFTYPLDLGTPIDNEGDSLQNHWVTFFINQSSNTQFPNYTPQYNVSNPNPSNPIAVVDTNSNNNLSSQSQLNQNNNASSSNFTTNNSQSTTRATTAITLYMPPSIQTMYVANWDGANGTNLGFAGNVAQSITGKTLTVSSFLAAAKGIGSAGIQQMASDIVKAMDVVASTLDIGSIQGTLSNAFRVAINPHAEILFNGATFRSFQFDFKFTPRNENEAIAAYNIIQAFKFYAAPELSTGQTGPFWIYPGTFDIQFYSNGQPNNFLNKISTCALVNISVNYTGGGMFTSFMPGVSGLNGVTTETNLTLNFIELQVIEKALILKGY